MEAVEEENNVMEEGVEEFELTYFNELPEELVIKVFSYLSPYTDRKIAKLVNKKWHRLIVVIEHHCNRVFCESIKSSNIMWKIRKQRSYDITETLIPGKVKGRSSFRTKVQRANLNEPHPRFSHSSVILGQYMYVFGGGSSESNAGSTFNDLYKLDLSNYTWQKVKTEGLLPAPRESGTMVSYKQRPSKHLYRTIPYKGKLILFGGWCQPPPGAILVGPRFFEDTQIFHVHDSRWQRINVDNNFPTPRAGHGASVVGNKMVIFGGSQRNNRLNDVWVFDIDALSWTCPYIRGQKPRERFGHSQFTLNDRMILVIGGCGGPNELLSDVWLYDVMLSTWVQLNVENQIYEPPDLWSHASVLVNGDVIVLSEEKKCPYCRSPIQNFSVPTRKPHGDAKICSCGRRNPDDMIMFKQSCFQMYLLDCSSLLMNSTCRWLNYKYLQPSPPARRMFSVNLGINEILIFGGLQNVMTQESKTDNHTIVISAKPSL